MVRDCPTANSNYSEDLRKLGAGALKALRALKTTVKLERSDGTASCSQELQRADLAVLSGLVWSGWEGLSVSPLSPVKCANDDKN